LRNNLRNVYSSDEVIAIIDNELMILHETMDNHLLMCNENNYIEVIKLATARQTLKKIKTVFEQKK
jgi:hypothetical protein